MVRLTVIRGHTCKARCRLAGLINPVAPMSNLKTEKPWII